jgi:hypothetical protein
MIDQIADRPQVKDWQEAAELAADIASERPGLRASPGFACRNPGHRVKGRGC